MGSQDASPYREWGDYVRMIDLYDIDSNRGRMSLELEDIEVEDLDMLLRRCNVTLNIESDLTWEIEDIDIARGEFRSSIWKAVRAHLTKFPPEPHELRAHINGYHHHW